MNEPCLPPVLAIRFDGVSDPAISARVQILHQEDQAARAIQRPDQIDWTVIGEQDRLRRVEIMQYLQAGQIQSPEDLYSAALIFQHGNCLEHFQLTATLAQSAMNLGNLPSRFLYAAAIDRALMHQGLPQKYGTQFRFTNDGLSGFYPVDPETTDEQRAEYGVPLLAESIRMMEEMNQRIRNMPNP